MRRRRLGRTGAEVSAVGFGGWAIGGGYVVAGEPIGYGKTDDFESLAALEAALDEGVSLFDTADAYGMGHSECLIGQVLQARRSDARVATKVGNVRRDPRPLSQDFSLQHIECACHASLRRLRRDVIDFYQLHHPPAAVQADGAVWDLLARLRREGRIRFVGASINAPEEAARLIRSGRVDFLQVPYTMLRPTWETAVFPLAIERDVGIIAREPLENGLLTGKFTLGTRFPKDDHRHALYHPERLTELLPKVERLKRTAECHGMTMTEMALRYVLSQPAVACVIPGAKRPAQVIENCGPGKAPELDKAVLAGIRETLGELGLTAGKT